MQTRRTRTAGSHSFLDARLSAEAPCLSHNNAIGRLTPRSRRYFGVGPQLAEAVGVALGLGRREQARALRRLNEYASARQHVLVGHHDAAEH